MNKALILTYEQNQTNVDQSGLHGKADYFKELKRCIESWRANAGYLKDIPIYVHSDAEIDLDYPGVFVVVKPYKKDLQSDFGFVRIYESGMMFQEMLPGWCLIHIDLDMVIKRELPRELFSFDGYTTVVGVYSKEDEEHQRQKVYGDYLAETDFIITKDSSFYSDYIRSYNAIRKIILSKGLREYDVEEYVADYLIYKKEYKIFERYEIGQGFYNKIDNPIFEHNHIYLTS